MGNKRSSNHILYLLQNTLRRHASGREGKKTQLIVKILNMDERHFAKTKGIEHEIHGNAGDGESPRSNTLAILAPQKEQKFFSSWIRIEHDSDLLLVKIKIYQPVFAAIPVSGERDRCQERFFVSLVFCRKRGAQQQAIFDLTRGSMFAIIDQAWGKRVIKLSRKGGIKGFEMTILSLTSWTKVEMFCDGDSALRCDHFVQTKQLELFGAGTTVFAFLLAHFPLSSRRLPSSLFVTPSYY